MLRAEPLFKKKIILPITSELFYTVTYLCVISEHYHIFVGDLSTDIETHQLRDAFTPFGEIS